MLSRLVFHWMVNSRLSKAWCNPDTFTYFSNLHIGCIYKCNMLHSIYVTLTPNPGHGHPHMKETIDLLSIEYLLKSFLQIARGQMKFAFIWKVQRINYTAESAARINWGQTGSKLKLFLFFYWKSGTILIIELKVWNFLIHIRPKYHLQAKDVDIWNISILT